MPEVELDEWHMIMRGPAGDEYPIASGPISATVLPHTDDDQVVVTVELAVFIRTVADQIEELATTGHIPDMTFTRDTRDVYWAPTDEPPSQ
jgi:hypothetical protein